MLMICLSILRDINLIIKGKIKELIKLDDEAEVVAVVKSAKRLRLKAKILKKVKLQQNQMRKPS